MFEIKNGSRHGSVKIPASKSMAHRYLICAALSGHNTNLLVDGMSKDIEATVNCLNALGARIEGSGEALSSNRERARFEKSGEALSSNREGARIEKSGTVLHCDPLDPGGIPENCVPDCGESGSTLRFLLPVVGALAAKGSFKMHGRLPERPLAPLDEELVRHGMVLKKQGDELQFSGALRAGTYTIPGTVSSQYISGLLFALPLLRGDSVLNVTGPVESRDYILMTEEALKKAGIRFEKTGNSYRIPGGQRYDMPGDLEVEGDFSNAAFFLSIGAFSEQGATVSGLNTGSLQGDRRIVEILEAFGAKTERTEDAVFVKGRGLKGITIDAALIPDLVPVLSVVGAAAEGETRIVNAGRLRLKESDRLKSTSDMINALGGRCEETADGLIITGSGRLKGGEVDTCNDHRIAMAAAVAACISEAPVFLTDETCVAKSYPGFFEDFDRLEKD
ncbi:MAG: 3-phosphoshikimate 1-carboxyvinyltransferase [Lachnospiraceae bacterium]|nr:3-phosphoshikimate 1-carboxyvinyltransferase [Lachnospiraceae bacterium]